MDRFVILRKARYYKIKHDLFAAAAAKSGFAYQFTLNDSSDVIDKFEEKRSRDLTIYTTDLRYFSGFSFIIPPEKVIYPIMGIAQDLEAVDVPKELT